MRRKSQRLSTNLRKTTNTQRAVRESAQPRGTKRRSYSGHHAQHRRNQRRQRAEREPSEQPTHPGDPHPHRKNHQPAIAHRHSAAPAGLPDRTPIDSGTPESEASAKLPTSLLVKPTGTRTKGRTGTIDHAIAKSRFGKKPSCKQSHRSITTAPRRLLVGGNNLRQPAKIPYPKHAPRPTSATKQPPHTAQGQDRLNTDSSANLPHQHHHARANALTLPPHIRPVAHNTQSTREHSTPEGACGLAQPYIRRTNQRISHRTGQHRNQNSPLIQRHAPSDDPNGIRAAEAESQTQRHQRHRAGRSTKSSRKIQRNTVNQKPQVGERHGGHGENSMSPKNPWSPTRQTSPQNTASAEQGKTISSTTP